MDAAGRDGETPVLSQGFFVWLGFEIVKLGFLQVQLASLLGALLEKRILHSAVSRPRNSSQTNARATSAVAMQVFVMQTTDM